MMTTVMERDMCLILAGSAAASVVHSFHDGAPGAVIWLLTFLTLLYLGAAADLGRRL